MIAKKDLKPHTYYKGKCRNARVAYWDGKVFHYFRVKFGDVFAEIINHIEDEVDTHWDGFEPEKEIELPREGL
jgi:hypothetical protein